MFICAAVAGGLLRFPSGDKMKCCATFSRSTASLSLHHQFTPTHPFYTHFLRAFLVRWLLSQLDWQRLRAVLLLALLSEGKEIKISLRGNLAVDVPTSISVSTSKIIMVKSQLRWASHWTGNMHFAEVLFSHTLLSIAVRLKKFERFRLKSTAVFHQGTLNYRVSAKRN